MNTKLDAFARLCHQAPLGLAAFLVAAVSGGLYLALVEVPAVLRYRELFLFRQFDPLLLAIVLGSGLALLLALFSLASEQRLWPGLAAAGCLLVTENLMFPMMPIWTLMLLGGKSAWLAFFYAAGMLIGLVLLVRRMTRLRTGTRAPSH